MLWLKDTFGVATTAGDYIRGEEYPSVDVARAQALDVQLVFIWHLIWMRRVNVSSAIGDRPYEGTRSRRRPPGTPILSVIP